MARHCKRPVHTDVTFIFYLLHISAFWLHIHDGLRVVARQGLFRSNRNNYNKNVTNQAYLQILAEISPQHHNIQATGQHYCR